MHRILIVGGGAGGLQLATKLGNTLGKKGKAKVVLVDKSPTHIWKPLLHEVAAGSLDPATMELSYAAQARWHHFSFVHGEMTDLNRSTRFAKIRVLAAAQSGHGESESVRELEYDTLVLSVGSVTNFFNVPGAQDNAIPLDSVKQAERFRKLLLQKCSTYRQDGGTCSSGQVRVAIIGAGATGVELAAELCKTSRAVQEYAIHGEATMSGIQITLIDGSTRILPALLEKVAASAAALLSKLDVEMITGDGVAEVHPGGVRLKSGRHLESDIVVWSAGIKGPELMRAVDGLEINRANQLLVNASLQSIADPNVFALGDCASCPLENFGFVPPRAQAAHQQATYLAKALMLRIDGVQLT